MVTLLTCSKTVPARGLGKLLCGLPQVNFCSGKPFVTLNGKSYCKRHGVLYVEQYLAAHGDPANVTWLETPKATTVRVTAALVELHGSQL